MNTIDFDFKLNSLVKEMLDYSFDYVGHSYDYFDTLYLFMSYEGLIYFDLFLKFKQRLYKCDQAFIDLLLAEKIIAKKGAPLNPKCIEKGEAIRHLFLAEKREVPKRIKIEYVPRTGFIDYKFEYDLKLSHPDAAIDHSFNEWFRELRIKEMDLAGYSKLTKNEYYSSFSELVELYCYYSYAKHVSVFRSVENFPWEFDKLKGEIHYGDQLTYSVQILGSYCTDDSTWMWAWSNKESNFEAQFLQQAHQLKKIGEQKNIKELTEPFFKADSNFDATIGMIATGLFNSDCFQCLDYGNGYLLVTYSIGAPVVLDNNNAPHYLNLAISNLEYVSNLKYNQYEAIKNYLIDKDCLIKLEKNKITGVGENLLITAEFDENNNIVRIESE